MTNHKKEAEQFLEDALDEYSREGGPIPGNVRDWLAIAQVNAALYLAEQQRIANLIALAAAIGDDPLDLDLPWAPGYDTVRVQIREELGFA